jgi:hypothetical protein
MMRVVHEAVVDRGLVFLIQIGESKFRTDVLGIDKRKQRRVTLIRFVSIAVG